MLADSLLATLSIPITTFNSFIFSRASLEVVYSYLSYKVAVLCVCDST